MSAEPPVSEGHRPRPRIAITLGDPNGIGPEVALRIITDSRLLRYVEPIVVGSAHVLGVHAAQLGYRDVKVRVTYQVPERGAHDEVIILDVAGGEKPDVRLGHTTSEGGRLSMRAVEAAVDLCLDGRADAVVTGPISKEAIHAAGYDVPGHTEFIARRVGAEAYTMMMVADALRVGLVSTHLPLADVPAAVTIPAIRERIATIADSLRRDFGIARPRMAVLGLNPHAGDGGIMGREEVETILPAVEAARGEGHLAFGPFAADGFFGTAAYRSYDAVLAMYHDQGLVAFKALTFNSGVNYTAGLPIVRTSPDHGTAFDIAGEGKANPGSMRSAVYLAIDICRRRSREPSQRRKAG